MNTTTGSPLRAVTQLTYRTRFKRDELSHPSVCWLAYDVDQSGADTGRVGYGCSAKEALGMLNNIRAFERGESH